MCARLSRSQRLEVPKSIHLCEHRRVDKVLDLHLQGQRFESSTLGSSYAIISKTAINRAYVDIAKK